jgi:hypothetical protein
MNRITLAALRLSLCTLKITRTYLKKKIFVPDQGEAKHQPAGILEYFEDLMRGFNADMGQKDFFEIGSSKVILS